MRRGRALRHPDRSAPRLGSRFAVGTGHLCHIKFWLMHLIRDRLSFMRFLDLDLEDPVPDATTIWLFREALAQAGLIDKLFERNAQIAVLVVGSCSQIEQGCAGCCPDCKQNQNCPCRRASSRREPWSLGLLFARFARFEMRLDPTHARIKCDRVRF